MPAGAFAPSKLHIDYGEWTKPAIGSADTGKAWVWNSATAKYEPAAFEPLGNAASAAAAAVSTHVGASNPHSQYLLSSAYTPVAPGGSTTQVQYNAAGAFAGDAGMTYDAATDRLAVAGGLIAPSLRPASNSTTALQWQNAAGTRIVAIDTTNNRLGINTTPAQTLHLDSGASQTIVRMTAAGDHWQIESDSALQFRNPTNGAVPMRFAYSGAITFGDIISVTRNTVPHVIKAQGYAITGGGALLWAASQDGNNGTWDIFRAENEAIGDTIKLRITNPGLVAVGGNTPTAWLDVRASTTARASLRIRSGVAPTSPNDGDIWFDGTHFYGRAGGVTKQLDN